MRTPKENKQKPRDRTPKSTAGTIPKATLKAVWLKTKEQTRTAAHEMTPIPDNRQRQTLRVRLRNSRQRLCGIRGGNWQKPKPGSTAKRKLLPASTPPMSAVSARNKPGAARCPMWRNARAVGQICPDSGRKKKPSPPRPPRAIFAVCHKVGGDCAPPQMKLCAV